jgi:hypothetical protein
MKEDNSTLPANMLELVQRLEVGGSVPLGNINEIPFLGLKVDEQQAKRD